VGGYHAGMKPNGKGLLPLPALVSVKERLIEEKRFSLGLVR
jgi:hypothetical protein